MKPYKRSDRVGEHIRRALSDLLFKRVHDPSLANAIVSGVDVAADLKLASVHFTVPGGEKERQAAMAGFQRAKGFLKRELARQLELRYMPELRFFYDESFDRGERMERIIHDLKQDDGSDHTATG